MTINWGALGLVAAVSLVIGVLIVVLVSLAVVGLSAREPDPAGEQTDQALVIGRDQSGGLSRTAGTVMAAICLSGAAAIVLYGLYLLVF
jgi:hypothetical protein